MTSRFFALLLLALAPACSLLDSSTSEDEVNASPFWKNTLSFPNEPFANSSGPSQPRWVKFSILAAEPTKIYFQDSKKYSFHFDFAKEHLPGFAAMTAAEFANASLKAAGQQVFVGAVLMPPRTETMEYGIQLLREDAYSKEDVKRLHDLVKASIVVEAGRSARAFYMPSFEQSASAQRDAEWLRANDVEIGSPERWLTADACYARGWAFGKAKFIAGADIKRAHLEGRLKTDDILVTDGVPAEVPYVAGIVSLAPSTPSSHVAILSQTWGIPFVFPVSQDERDAIRSLATGEEEVALRTRGTDDGAFCKVEVIKPEGTVDAATRAYLAELRRPPPVDIPGREHLGALTKPAVELTPADVRHFGGKASNFGTLNRTLPENSPKALGISFDLWEAFLAQTLPSGRTLEEEVDSRLRPLSFPPDIGALESKLEEIRKLVTDTATLPVAMRTKLLVELAAFGFDPKVKIRFRSSTNVEDGTVLSGAGLYDSFSGCLADDLDADTTGPSACDPGEGKERGVERAVKKVFASFYNTNAVLERLKYRIPESKVGMALAVHVSFPDETEAANGVATFQRQGFFSRVELVSQPGAESVTNPDGRATPELVSVDVVGSTSDDAVPIFVQSSSLVPIGGKVLTWDRDYKELALLIERAGRAFQTDHALPRSGFTLDVEYKKDTAGKLILKQIRQVPRRSTTPSVIPVLLSQPHRLCLDQGEFGDVVGFHRLKTQGMVSTRNTKLSDEALATPLVSSVDFEMMESGSSVTKAGAPASFAGAEHEIGEDWVRDSWMTSAGTMILQAQTTRLVSPAAVPIFVARDFRWTLAAIYRTPQSTITPEGIGETDHDHVELGPCAAANDVSDVRTIEGNGPRGLHVTTRFRYRQSSMADMTAALGKWEETEIRGLVSEPIVLRGWFSQTFRPQHHNFGEDFMFEPALEENLPAAIRQELSAKDIGALVMLNAAPGNPDGAQFYVLRKSTQKLEAL